MPACAFDHDIWWDRISTTGNWTNQVTLRKLTYRGSSSSSVGDRHHLQFGIVGQPSKSPLQRQVQNISLKPEGEQSLLATQSPGIVQENSQEAD